MRTRTWTITLMLLGMLLALASAAPRVGAHSTAAPAASTPPDALLNPDGTLRLEPVIYFRA